MSERTTSIERWFRRNAEMKQDPWRRIRGVHDGHGLYYTGAAIEYSGGEGTAAGVVRDGNGTLPPLVRMGLPNQVTIRRFRDIYNTILANEGTVLVAPRNVISAADIHLPSVEMIAAERKPRRFRPPQQVLKARIRLWNGKWREAYFMSGYDLNERGLSYFFCELPKDARPTTVDEAYRALQPESVKIALAQKRRVRRQGDMFFIETDRGEGPAYNNKKCRLFHTNHFAEEFGYGSDDVRYVRGDITHEPSGRRPDHKTLRLPGGRWWIAVQNTVPVTRNY